MFVLMYQILLLIHFFSNSNKKFRYRKPPNNAPGVIIETHETPFSWSI